MLGKYSVSNLKSIAKLKPALAVNNNDKQIQIALYINKPSDLGDYEVIGYLQASKSNEKLNGKNVYCISGTSGAYVGFGSLTYQSLLIEISKANNNAVLICDRESITDEAESIYRKMNLSEDFIKEEIPDSSALFSDYLEEDVFPEDLDWEEHREKVNSGEIPPYVLNQAYSFKGNSDSEGYHNVLLSNHKTKRLNSRQFDYIMELGENLGEWVEMNRDRLIEMRNDNFKELISDLRMEELFPEP